VVVLDKDWPQHDAFVALLRTTLESMPLHPAYYPGTKARYDRFRQNAGAAGEVLSGSKPGTGRLSEKEKEPLPFLWIQHTVSDGSGGTDVFSLRNEPFAPVLTIVSLEGGANDPIQFLPRAVTFVNDRLFGSLVCSLSVHPSVEAHPAVTAAVENLQYGAIMFNAVPAMSYLAMDGVSGAFPGEQPDAVESGIGVIHNCRMFKGAEKVVVKMPFKNHLAKPLPTDLEKGPKPLAMRRGVEFAIAPTACNFSRMIGAMCCCCG
jgi:hypothetical protein